MRSYWESRCSALLFSLRLPVYQFVIFCQIDCQVTRDVQKWPAFNMFHAYSINPILPGFGGRGVGGGREGRPKCPRRLFKGS